MKRIVQHAALFVMFSSLLFAAPRQEDGNRQQTVEQIRQRLEQIKERLQLTPEQIEQVRPILLDEVQQLRAVEQKYNESDQNRRARLKTAREVRGIRSFTDKKLQKILSKSQMEDLKKIREEFREERRERAGPRQ
jgi:DNA replication protein DnaD